MHDAAATRKGDHASIYERPRQTMSMGHDDAARAAIRALVDAGECSREEAEAAAPVALEADGDLPLLEWVEIIRRERRRARRGERGRPITDADL